MPSAAKAIWTVTAGFVFNEPIQRLSKQWVLNNTDPRERFREMCSDANVYAQSLQNPQTVNWVKLEFIWL